MKFPALTIPSSATRESLLTVLVGWLKNATILNMDMRENIQKRIIMNVIGMNRLRQRQE